MTLAGDVVVSETLQILASDMIFDGAWRPAFGT